MPRQTIPPCLRLGLAGLALYLGSASTGAADQAPFPAPSPFLVPMYVFPAPQAFYPQLAHNPYLPQVTQPLPPTPAMVPWPFYLMVPRISTPPDTPAAAPTPAAPTPVSTAPEPPPATEPKPTQPAAPAPATPPPLSAEAREALAAAEAAVQAARAAYALWVPAETALQAARDAAWAGDSARVLNESREVAELTRLGAEQARYPSTETAAPAATQPAKAGKAKAKTKSKAKAKTPAKPNKAAKPHSAKAIPKPQAPAKRSTPAPSSQTRKDSAPAPTAAPAPLKPRKLCWQGDRLEACP